MHEQPTTTEPGSVIAKLILLFTLFGGLILCGCGAERRVRIGGCDAHRPGAALVTRHVVVFGSRTARLPVITSYYACRRPAGKALDLGVDELGSVYGSDATTGGFKAAGTYVAVQSSSGEASLAVCARYSNTRLCTPAQHWITVVDTSNHRGVRVPVYASLPVPALVPFPLTVALSPTGAVAWLQNATAGANVTASLQLWTAVLTPRGPSGFAAVPALTDAGSIDPSSLRFERRTLYWVRDHVPHRQMLHQR